MAPHVSHVGVHDHGFNNVSTYGNMRRLMLQDIGSKGVWDIKHERGGLVEVEVGDLGEAPRLLEELRGDRQIPRLQVRPSQAVQDRA